MVQKIGDKMCLLKKSMYYKKDHNSNYFVIYLDMILDGLLHMLMIHL